MTESLKTVAPGKRTFESRLFSYALAGGAALVGSGVAQAGVVHYGGPPLDTAGGSINLDLDGDFVNDFTFNSGSGTNADAFFSANVQFSSLAGVTAPLPPGTIVNASSTFGASSYKINKATVDVNGVVTSSGGPYSPNTDQYMGLRFDISGNIHYGWALIDPYYTGSGDGTNGSGRVDVLIKDYAYEDVTDAGIAAGTPEPSSLALFALGAAGIAAVRRRKTA